MVVRWPAACKRRVPGRGLPTRCPEALDARTHFYFIADGSRGASVFRLTLRTGHVRELWSGAPLVAPSGITVSDDGDEVFIADPQAGGGGAVTLDAHGDAWVSDLVTPGWAVVVHVSGGSATPVTNLLRAGTPPGIATTRDGAVVALSGLDEINGTALVHLIDTATFTVTTANTGIADNIGAGGLHRAARTDVFSWAGIRPGGQGAIYMVTF